eukprot:COSAG05_NODE_341_length_11060_cov_29.709424_8_plen_214_part_00
MPVVPLRDRGVDNRRGGSHLPCAVVRFFLSRQVVLDPRDCGIPNHDIVHDIYPSKIVWRGIAGFTRVPLRRSQVLLFFLSYLKLKFQIRLCVAGAVCFICGMVLTVAMNARDVEWSNVMKYTPILYYGEKLNGLCGVLFMSFFVHNVVRSCHHLILGRDQMFWLPDSSHHEEPKEPQNVRPGDQLFSSRRVLCARWLFWCTRLPRARWWQWGA